MAIDGISALIQMAQTKSNNANEEALHAAGGQTKLINEQKHLRGQQRVLEEALRDKDVTDGEYWKIKQMLDSSGMSNAGVDGGWSSMLGTYEAGHEGEIGHWHAALSAEGQGEKNQKMADAIKTRYTDAVSDLEGQDKTDNFVMQDLMSTVNQNETLASSLLKKADDTKSGVIGKI